MGKEATGWSCRRAWAEGLRMGHFLLDRLQLLFAWREEMMFLFSQGGRNDGNLHSSSLNDTR